MLLPGALIDVDLPLTGPLPVVATQQPPRRPQPTAACRAISDRHLDSSLEQAALLAEQALGRQPAGRVTRRIGAGLRARLLAHLARLDHEMSVSIEEGVLVICVVLDPGGP